MPSILHRLLVYESIVQYLSLYYLFIYLFYWFERETLTCCSTYLYIQWMLLVCALTGDRTCNLGVSGWSSNQQSSSVYYEHKMFTFTHLWSKQLYFKINYSLSPLTTIFKVNKIELCKIVNHKYFSSHYLEHNN